MDNLNVNEELQGTANTAEAEKENEVAADLGKFKDVKALLSAYNSLESEFTRRSQRLKELEGKSKATTEPDEKHVSEPSSAQNKTRNLYEEASGDEEVRKAIIADYLKAVTSGRGAPMVAGGFSVPSPKSKPASIKEAGRLAQEFLKNN